MYFQLPRYFCAVCALWFKRFFLALIKILIFSLIPAYFKSVGNPHLEAAEETIQALQSDRDQDVSFFATIKLRQNNMDGSPTEKQN